jgi:hypothetical protein
MDITLKGIENCTEEEVKEWVSILVERKENQKINSIPQVLQAQADAKLTVDSFRKANTLIPKFEKTNEDLIV